MEGGFLPAVDPASRHARRSIAVLDPPPLQEQTLRREREQRIAATSSKCSQCGVAGDAWSEPFGSCSRCLGTNASLISKKTAKELYLLTDGDLTALGSVPRANPHGKTLAPMRLYLESQVRAVAAERHGGGFDSRNDDEDDDELGGGGFIPEGVPKNRSLDASLEQARLARVEKRLSDRAARRAAESAKEANAAAKLARARAAVEERCSRLEVDEAQRAKKKKVKETPKKKRKKKKSSSESDDESDESDDGGVEVETI